MLLPSHDTGVSPTRTRRRFTAADKRTILEAAAQCTKPGELRALLRREGLYTSHLAPRRGPTPVPQDPRVKRTADLQRQLARATARAATRSACRPRRTIAPSGLRRRAMPQSPRHAPPQRGHCPRRNARRSSTCSMRRASSIWPPPRSTPRCSTRGCITARSARCSACSPRRRKRGRVGRIAATRTSPRRSCSPRHRIRSGAGI